MYFFFHHNMIYQWQQRTVYYPIIFLVLTVVVGPLCLGKELFGLECCKYQNLVISEM